MQTKKMDCIYKKATTRDVELTFLPPIVKKWEKAPVLLLIPGGGWHFESRSDMIAMCQKTVDDLRNNGFAVISIDYRVYNYDDVKMPVVLSDCFDALRYICKNSSVFQVDTNKIITCGHSAGGHLAMMLAYNASSAYGIDMNDVKYKIQAVVGLSPVTIIHDKSYHSMPDTADVFDREDALNQMIKASPLEYINEACPTTFIVAGTEDDIIYDKSSKLLYHKLMECGAKGELLLVEGAGHSFEKMKENVEPSLSLSEIQDKVTEFILKEGR